MKKFRVCILRDVQEECFLYVDGKDEADARRKAVELVKDETIADAIWLRTNIEPQYTVDGITPTDTQEF